MDIWDNDIYTLKTGEIVGVSLHIYGNRGTFLLFIDDQDTESE